MEDLFKKFIYTGVGWISITAEKFKKTIDKFVDDGKISSEEGKKIVDDFLKNTETKRDELENQFKSVVDKVIKSVSFAKKEELKELAERIAKLEAQIAKSSPEKKKTTTRKTTAKKTTTRKTNKKDDSK